MPAVETVPLSLIDDDGKLRDRVAIDDESVRTLAQSLGQHGLINPLTVRRTGERFELVAGSRRLRAAHLLGWREIPVHIVDAAPDQSHVLTAIENLERQNLSPIEEAGAVAALYQDGDQDIDAIAARLGRSRAWIDSRLEMTTWPPEITQPVHTGDLKPSAAKWLAQVKDPQQRAAMIEYAVIHGITAKTAQLWAQQAETEAGPAETPPPTPGQPQQPDQHFETQGRCFITGAMYPIDQLRSVMLSPEAIDMIANAAAGKSPPGPA